MTVAARRDAVAACERHLAIITILPKENSWLDDRFYLNLLISI
jgi:hypothetical protein